MKKIFKVNKDFNNSRFDKWFKSKILDVPHSLIEKLIRKRSIKVNHKRTKTSYRVQTNDLVEIYLSFKTKGDIDNIKVYNNILFDVFQVQKNVVLINFKNQTQSHIFSFSDREKTFTY